MATDAQPMRSITVRPTCADCRFGAGYPQGPQRRMRCVHPGDPTSGQFLRGPGACAGFEERAVAPCFPAAPTGAICRGCLYGRLEPVERACSCTHPATTPRQRLRSSHAPACQSYVARVDDYPSLCEPAARVAGRYGREASAASIAAMVSSGSSTSTTSLA